MPRSRRSRKTLWISDTHEMSDFGLAPIKFITQNQTIIQANPVQKILAKYWNQFENDRRVKECDSCGLLGDLIEGNNPNEFGRQLTSTELNEQAQSAINRLYGITKSMKSVFGISGSPYHRGKPFDADKLIIKHLGGVYLGNSHVVDIGGVKVFIAHKAGGAKLPQTKASALAKNRMLLSLAEQEELPYRVDLMIYAHWHEYIRVDNVHSKSGVVRTVIALPCWKAKFDWDKTAGTTFAYKTTIGGVVTEFKNGNVEKIEPIVYPSIELIPKPIEV